MDDLIGVAEGGYKTDQLNSYVNVKTADKDLQFGPEKCKVMVISKVKPQLFHKPKLTVDAWKLNHLKNGKMREEFEGKVSMKEENNLMYLCFMLSKNGGNMQNIIHKRNKCIGTEKKILRLVKPLGPYTFECGLIYIQSLIRNSILYASETMYYVTEKHYRAMESIEESVLKKLLHTKSRCSRHLEAGLVPARNQIHRQGLNYLKYISNQPINSIVHRMFESMRRNQKRGDWASSALKLIEKYELNLTLQEIKEAKLGVLKPM